MQHSSEGHGRKICCLPCLCPLHVFSRGRHSVSPFFAAQTHGQGQTYSWILCTGVQTHSSSIQVKMRVHLTIEFWIQIFRPALCYSTSSWALLSQPWSTYLNHTCKTHKATTSAATSSATDFWVRNQPILANALPSFIQARQVITLSSCLTYSYIPHRSC